MSEEYSEVTPADIDSVEEHNYENPSFIHEQALALTPELELELEPITSPAPVIYDSTPVSGNSHDEVHISKVVYKNVYSQKSLSVHHVQRRLYELGFLDAASDSDGWYGDLTKLSVEQFQNSKGLDVNGILDLTSLARLFEGDPLVVIVD